MTNRFLNGRRSLLREADKARNTVRRLTELSNTLVQDIEAVECGDCPFEEFVERVELTFQGIGWCCIRLKGISVRQFSDDFLEAARMSTSGPSIN